ncbi:MBL fold metallo-hydrolase [Kiloniella sp. b19]|uniref:MBL fold metallo-hydrolase n=1 Tax=Kiloniella sp. GXU_MW_B19 TaxID=3141326 RepID=UPI0031CFEF19
MEITLLGTGCPAVHTERYGAGQIVVHNQTAVLIDCGSGVTQRLVGAGYSGRVLDALVLTHLHSDHLIDFYQLVISAWHQGREKPQVIYGPEGTRDFVEKTMAVWQEERELRIAHEKRPSVTGLELEVHEIRDGDRLEIGDLLFEVVAVDHQPVDPAFGFVISAEDTDVRIALSGDTTECERLIAAAQGVDLLVHEVFIHRDMPVVPGVRSAETIEAVASYHTLSDVVGKVATRANAGALLLTHIVPPDSDRAVLLAEVKADFSGPVLVGEDLMRVNPQGKTVRYGAMQMSYA